MFFVIRIKRFFYVVFGIGGNQWTASGPYDDGAAAADDAGRRNVNARSGRGN